MRATRAQRFLSVRESINASTSEGHESGCGRCDRSEIIIQCDLHMQRKSESMDCESAVFFTAKKRGCTASVERSAGKPCLAVGSAEQRKSIGNLQNHYMYYCGCVAYVVLQCLYIGFATWNTKPLQ